MTRDTPHDDEVYRKPRGRTPHPDDTPLDPYSPRELDAEPETEFKRPLLMVAKKIRTTEAQLKGNLSDAGVVASGDLRDVTINPQREMVMNPAKYPASKRASTAQSNLESHYRRWATLCEKHSSAVRALNEQAEDDQ